MAINIKPDISLSAKPPATMTLPEMINMARGAQAYQREREIFPELVQQAKTQTQQTQFSLDKDQTAGIMSLVGGYRNDPRINSGDANQAAEAMQEIRSKAVAIGIPEKRVDDLMRMGNAIALRSPTKLPQYFDNVIQSQIGPTGQQGLQTPQLVTSGGQTGIFRPGSAAVTTLPLPSAPPAPGGVTSQDMTAPIQNKPAPAAAAPAQTSQIVQPDTGRLPLTYPVRQAGVPFAALPQEETDRTAGSQIRNNLIQRQSELTLARENLRGVIKGAEAIKADALFPETGISGKIKRTYSELVGDPQYKQLSKDLANLQIANIKAMGGSLDTVAGQQLTREASGDETYPPDVLLSIARRTDGQMTNVDMMATGMQRHTEKFGDANANRFRQMWSANADSRIFEIMNIARDVKDVKKREELTNKLLGDMDDNQRKDLYRKYNNLVKLTNSGDL